MSSHLNVYVGWFFKVPKVMTERVKETPACVNPECPSHGAERRAKFCQDCGQPMGVIEDKQQVEAQLSLYNLNEEWMDVMSQVGASEGGEHFWVPNHQGYGTRMSNYQDNEVVFMDSETVKEEFARFKSRYYKFSKAIERAYGVTLTPAYGVIPYYR